MSNRPVPFAHRGFFLVPFMVGGMSPGGVWLENERGESLHHAKLPAIFGRVTDVHRTCRFVHVGDWIVFLPKRPVRLPYVGGVVYALTEVEVLAVVEAGDGVPWFAKEKAA